jgi:hypothetical protein
MNTDNNRNDAEKNPVESSILKQDERTDRNLFREFGLAALAGLSAFFSAALTTVVDGNSALETFLVSGLHCLPSLCHRFNCSRSEEFPRKAVTQLVASNQ